MTDSLERLRRAAVTPAASRRESDPPTPGESDEDECPAFGYLRGSRDRSAFVEFRFADGNSTAYPYSWLGPVTYNPSAGLLLRFVGDRATLVLIEGTNLNGLVGGGVTLFDRGLQRHRVTWVREMTRHERERAADGEVIVSRIWVASAPPDGELESLEWVRAFRRDE